MKARPIGSEATDSSEVFHTKVCVIGAGLSGLVAAYRLLQNGVDVHLFEARSRVGGRVYSIMLDDEVGEIGGQNISDGGEAKHLRSLLKEFGLKEVASTVNRECKYFDGEKTFEVEKLIEKKKFNPNELYQKLQKVAANSKNMKEVLCQVLSSDDPLYKALEVKLEAYEGGTLDSLSSCYVETLFYMLLGGMAKVHEEHGMNSDNLELSSVSGGNAKLTEELHRRLKGRVHLQKELVKVERVNGDLDSKSLWITFADGKKIQAEKLVLTIPCSVFSGIDFKKGTIPKERVDKIKKVSYGKNAKLLVPGKETKGSFPVVLQENSASFYEECCRILTIYFTGDSSRFDESSVKDKFFKEKNLIEKEFQLDLADIKQVDYADNIQFGRYSNSSVGYSWVSDRFSKGSYSYIAAGCEEEFLATSKSDHHYGKTVRSMFTPIAKQIYFAGEHTSSLIDILGTMEAACESGESVAKLIQLDI